MSLVDMRAVDVEPVEADAGRPRAAPRRSAGGVGHGVGGEHDEHRGHRRRDHPGALGDAADAPAGAAVCATAWARCPWSCTAVAAAVPASGAAASSAAAFSTPASRAARGQLLADQAGGAHRDLDGAAARVPRRPSRPWRGWSGSPPGPVHALAPPELRTTARSAPAGEHLLRPQHRRGLDLVAGEHAGGGAAGAVVDDEREVEPPAVLDPGGDAGGPEALRRAVMLTAPLPSAAGPCLGQAEGQVHALHGAARGALGEVVDRGDGDQPAARRRRP